ncbi:MAG: Holliday junction resolvase RuvX [Oscillospiraceae bacterium]|nr:Holliday junction resolvase RuvX [Oscillospiraceae bacterium]
MKILAVDLGDVRTGLAICDSAETIASPLNNVKGKNLFRMSEAVAQVVKDREAELVVVGLPINMDGTEGERAKKCRKFSEVLRKDLNDIVTVELWDERITTVQAYKNLYESNVHGKKARELIDSEAARLILENYLLYRRNLNKE